MTENEYKNIRIAFNTLMGINGDIYVKEIYNNNSLSQASYDAICENIKFNSKDSIIEHFGLVHYYYLQGIEQRSVSELVGYENLPEAQ